MSVPDFQTLMRPILEHLSDGGDRAVKDLVEALSDRFQLTEEERAELIPSGRQRRMYNKVHWAVTHLFQAGLLTRPSRGHVRITDAGHDVLARYADRVDMSVLRTFPSYVEFRARTRGTEDGGVAAPTLDSAEEHASPSELLARALAENRAAIEQELLARALTLDPAAFERLVLAVLEGMGYGRLGGFEHSGRPGDAGIDGIISQDPLGLDRIYIQAKRYDPTNGVQRPDIQRFVGALMGAQGDRGVFLTTSSFSRGARDEAERVNARVELIDGARLVALMVDHRVGVREAERVVLHEVNEEFFDSV